MIMCSYNCCRNFVSLSILFGQKQFLLETFLLKKDRKRFWQNKFLGQKSILSQNNLGQNDFLKKKFKKCIIHA